MPNSAFKRAFYTFLRRAHTTRAQASEAFATHWPHYMKHGGVAAFVWQARHLHLRDTRNVIAALQRLELPMRIVWGAEDRFVPVRYGFRFARDLDATFEYIFNGRHFTSEDYSQLVVRAINVVVVRFREREYRYHLHAPRLLWTV